MFIGYAIGCTGRSTFDLTMDGEIFETVEAAQAQANHDDLAYPALRHYVYEIHSLPEVPHV